VGGGDTVTFQSSFFSISTFFADTMLILFCNEQDQQGHLAILNKLQLRLVMDGWVFLASHWFCSIQLQS